MYEIPELREIPKIDNFDDLIKLSNFVFKTIPHAGDTGIDIEHSVSQIYNQFKNRQKFGWCYTNSLYMHLILSHYGRSSYLYNYGLDKAQLTHTVLIANIGASEYLIDPYFNRYYISKTGFPLTFYDLIKAIKNNDEIFIKYGSNKKYVKQGNNFIEWTPQQLQESVFNSWVVNLNYNQIMHDTFKDNNVLLLIPKVFQRVRVLIKIDGKKYFEFF